MQVGAFRQGEKDIVYRIFAADEMAKVISYKCFQLQLLPFYCELQRFCSLFKLWLARSNLYLL